MPSNGRLTIGRKQGESIAIIVPPSDKPQTIEISVAEVKRSRARLGFTADRSIRVHRKEVIDAIAKDGERRVPGLLRIGDALPGVTRCQQ